MRSRFGLKLFLFMAVFAMVITTVIATMDHFRLAEQVVTNNELQIRQIQEVVEYTINNIEKSYYLFGREIDAKMEAITTQLLKRYEVQPQFDEWDFTKLKQEYGLDIYIIDRTYTIIHSSIEEDIGLNFIKCCRKLADILEKRRQTGLFHADGIDIEQTSGHLKKYSYMATPDKEYMVELSYNLEEDLIFKQFNFLDEINDFVEKYPSIHEINVLNMGGNRLGQPRPTAEQALPHERRVAFEQALAQQEAVELKGALNGFSVVYRYVPYIAQYDDGVMTKAKIIEIVYDERELLSLLSENKKTFILQLFIVLLLIIISSLLFSRWISKPMYLAFHDSLTGLRNRAAFDEFVHTAITSNKGKQAALLMIDIDDFKQVNDDQGHDIGDEQLRKVAQTIQTAVRKQDRVFRMGGDEFIIILPDTTEQEAIATARRIIHLMKHPLTEKTDSLGGLTVSIGISLAPEHGLDPEALYKSADIALYMAKASGKNQYKVFETE